MKSESDLWKPARARRQSHTPGRMNDGRRGRMARKRSERGAGRSDRS